MELTAAETERFWSYVAKGEGCWVWTGGRFTFGHGSFWLRKKNLKASRIAFLLAHGRWPNPCALHKCDNPACCNPDHLFEGTLADNNADAAAKGRARGGAPPWPRNGKTKLDPDRVLAIRKAFALGATKAALAREYGIGETAVRQVVSRTTWRHLP